MDEALAFGGEFADPSDGLALEVLERAREICGLSLAQ
jgi:hypothetical protein